LKKSFRPSPFGVKNLGTPITAICLVVVPHPFLSYDKSGGGGGLLKLVSGHQISLIIEALSIVGTLSSSGKWPSDPEVVAKTKTAFLIQISELLLKQFEVRNE
jgi:hypothetical protein